MEKLIVFFGERLYRIRLAIDDFFVNISKSNTKKILFLIAFFAPIALVAAFFNNAIHNIFYKIIFVIGYLLIALIIFSIYAVYAYSEKGLKTGFYGFKMIKISIHTIDYASLLLEGNDKENFVLLLRGRKVTNRINYKLPTKNKTSANELPQFLGQYLD